MSQVFVDRLNVGDLVTNDIQLGGWQEIRGSEDCNCRLFVIKRQPEVLALYLNKNDTLIGKIVMKEKLNVEDAKKSYIRVLGEFLRYQKAFKGDWKYLSVRDSDRGMDDGIYFLHYSIKNENNVEKRITGIASTLSIDESYLDGSNYEPKFINQQQALALSLLYTFALSR